MSGTTGDLVIDDTEVDGVRAHVVIRNGVIVHIGDDPGRVPGQRIAAAGGALLPGLHDHHIHLLATAAAMASIDLSAAPSLEVALGDAPGDGWLRVVGYHDAIAGQLDRWVLDRVAPDRPVRVQHRSGMMWVLNSAALRSVGAPLPIGAMRRADGEPDGRFLREDDWLRARLAATEVPNLDAVFAALRRQGITSVTDMTPVGAIADLQALADAVAASCTDADDLRVTASTAPALSDAAAPVPLRLGPVKVLADEDSLPELDDLVGWITAAHARGRSVAVHCVTRAVLAFVLAAFESAGSRRGDRIEHGAVVPPDFADQLHRLGLIVVTQPAFIHARGDQYRVDVDADDLPHLWPCGSLLDAGVGVGASTDAPFGPLDPWMAMETATRRTTSTGAVLGAGERIDASTALSMWLSSADAPAGPSRTVSVGAAARLCLIDRPLADALAHLADVRVVRTIAHPG